MLAALPTDIPKMCLRETILDKSCRDIRSSFNKHVCHVSRGKENDLPKDAIPLKLCISVRAGVRLCGCTRAHMHMWVGQVRE